jgi:2,4-dienoyl-CoA reductase-like NADH-dependent reductase (Old Yellow Enzyme family)/thioredoxin reductase
MISIQFPKLFEPIEIRKLQLRNRIVMPSMETCFAEESGEVSERNVAYYRERAKGGVGWIIVENTYMDKQGRSRRGQIGVHRDEMISGLKRLVDAVHSYGAKISLQISHAGRQTKSQWAGEQPVAPSPIACTPSDEMPRPLEINEIKKIINSFGKAALRAKKAGFDGVEIHGAHGYLIHQFLSPLSNRRTDIYGGPLENRMRLPLEVLAEVRKSVGEEFLVGYRISASDYVDGGLKIEETLRVAQALETKGLDVLNVSGGMAGLPECGFMVTPPMVVPRGIHVPLAESMKKGLRLPIIVVGRINTPELAEKILAEGKADLIAMGRAFLADPLWPSKALSGKAEEIRRCIACNEACSTRLGQHLPIMCVQNPLLGREGEIEMKETPRKKKVIIIGGGPGGLEAARICALRGHEVSLYEEHKELGGRLLSAVLAPHKEEVRGILDYQIGQVKRLPIEIRLEVKVDHTFLKEKNPDTVIIATGSIPLGIEVIRGEKKKGRGRKIPHAEDVLGGKAFKGKKIAVIGGGMIGCEVSEFLIEKGKKVCLIEMLDDLALDMSARPRMLLLKRLRESGQIEILTKTKVKRIEGQTIIVERAGKEIELEKMDGIVLSIGYRSDDRLFRSLKAGVHEIFSIGDCVKPRKAFEAIQEGFEVGLKV